MSQPLATQDAAFVPSDAPTGFEAWARRYVKDPRDVPFARLMAEISLVVIPFAIVLFAIGDFPWWVGLIYLAMNGFLFLDRFILMLHNTSHRRLFRKEYGWANHLIPWAFGPLFGESPWTYYAHHIGMHHPENNLPDDLSSTMRFKRDSAVDFLRYFGRFITIGIFELIRYHLRRKRLRMMRQAIIGELSFLAVAGVLLWLRPEATLVVFVLPLVLVRLLMMAGNWGQHAFIDRRAPESPYLNSITCINSRYNRRCFNDGYHIGHHVKPNRHWTDMPVVFNAEVDRYRKEGALVFEGIDFFMVWAALMFKRYGYLADRVVMCGEQDVSDKAAVIAVMRERLKPIRS